MNIVSVTHKVCKCLALVFAQNVLVSANTIYQLLIQKLFSFCGRICKLFNGLFVIQWRSFGVCVCDCNEIVLRRQSFNINSKLKTFVFCYFIARPLIGDGGIWLLSKQIVRIKHPHSVSHLYSAHIHKMIDKTQIKNRVLHRLVQRVGTSQRRRKE